MSAMNEDKAEPEQMHKTVKTRFWSWPLSKGPETLFNCSLFAEALRV